MKTFSRITESVMLAATLAVVMSTGVATAQYGAPRPYARWGYGAPSAEFAEAQQRGFRDGVDGARKDFENHRLPNVNNRDEFRRPNFIPRFERRDYRFGFERGYNSAARRIYGSGLR